MGHFQGNQTKKRGLILKFPGCFYTKAFWVVVPLLTVSMGSGVMAVNNQLSSNWDYDYTQDKHLTDLTYDVNQKLTNIQVNQMLICDKLDVNCR